MGSSARIWSVFCCVRTITNENQDQKDWVIVSLKTPKAVYSASERKYTAVVWDVQAPWGGIHEWQKSEQRIDTWIGKANAVLRELYFSVVTKRELSKTAKRSVFKSLFRSSPVVTNLTAGDHWKNTVKRTNGRDGIFAKSSWCDTSWQRAQVWNP